MDIRNIRVIYDRFVDVLFINLVDGNPIQGFESDHKIMWRYNDLGILVAITVIDFKELGDENLFNLIDDFLKGSEIPNHQLLKLIRDIV